MSTTASGGATTPTPPKKGASGRKAVEVDKEQVGRLVGGAIGVANQLARSRSPKKPVTIHEAEAEYLQLVPYQILHDVTELAIRRVQMRGESGSHMQRGDIEWAVSRLVVGNKRPGWLTVVNSLGGILLGAGIPLIYELVTSTPAAPPTTAQVTWALVLSIPGIGLLTAALVLAVRR